MICEAGFYNAFYYFGYERKVGDWTVVRELADLCLTWIS